MSDRKKWWSNICFNFILYKCTTVPLKLVAITKIIASLMRLSMPYFSV